MSVYLAGDIGGTKTRLAAYAIKQRDCECVKQQKFPSKNYPNLRSIIKKFLETETWRVHRACFGIAGPVRGNISHATNLPWLVDAQQIAHDLCIETVALINDLEAHAYGIKLLPEKEFSILNEGDPSIEGNQAMISAGTGLGEAGIYFDGKHHYPFACEGGHGDFGPRNELEDELLKYLRAKFQHVSYERILSGPGLCNIYQFLIETKREKEKLDLFEEIQRGDSARLISEMGMNQTSFACMQALHLFASIYGSEAGNLALKMFALGGVFLGGGIAPKILEVMKQGSFIENFKKKGRFYDLLSQIPVKVSLNDQTALLGSFHYASKLMETPMRH